MKTYFATALLGAATQAFTFDYDAIYGASSHAYQPYQSSSQVYHGGPLYRTRPPAVDLGNNIDEKIQPSDSDHADDRHVSTDDDRYSSSDSDSLSSSDFHTEDEVESTCEQNGDPYACRRVKNADTCMTTQTFNEGACMCFEKYICRDLTRPKHYGAPHNNCPAEIPFVSQIDNCKCLTYEEHFDIYAFDFGYKCHDVPRFKTAKSKVEVYYCNSQTDSDSDCVRGNDRFIFADAGKGQIDENGNDDSSIYTDPNCDSRYSSCDTNSAEEFSNTDSVTESSEESKTLRTYEDPHGSLGAHYGARYGVYVESETSEEEHHYGYGYGHYYNHDDSNSDPDLTSYNTEFYTTDSCEPNDFGEGCTVDPFVESEQFTEHVHEDSFIGPTHGTSNSSNSTGDPFSESDSAKDSSSDGSSDTEDEESSLSEDLCAHVIMQPAHGSEVWGWVEFYAPAKGAHAGSTRIEMNFENLLEEGDHAISLHEYGDLSRQCRSAGHLYNPSGQEEGELGNITSSWRGLASYYDWNDLIRLDGEYSILGRSVVVNEGPDGMAGDTIGCGIIQPGCSPCRDHDCFPEYKSHSYGYSNYHY